MARRTPPLLAKGRYQLKAPFSAGISTVYVCKAIRTFDDIVKLNIDVFEKYYKPWGLTDAEYEADRREGACIITLMSSPIGIEADAPELVYVPDTFILSYPDMTDVLYNHVVLSLSLGAIPDYLSLDFLKERLSEVASDVIGVEPVVNEHIALSSGAVSPAQHETRETIRLAAINTRTTSYSRVQELQASYQDLMTRYQALEQALLTLQQNQP